MPNGPRPASGELDVVYEVVSNLVTHVCKAGGGLDSDVAEVSVLTPVASPKNTRSASEPVMSPLF